MTKEHDGWIEERRSAWLYRAVAAAERDGGRRALFAELAAEADKQADMWARRAQTEGRDIAGEFQPDVRARVVALLVHWLGPKPLRGVLSAMKVRGMSIYTKGVPGHFMAPAVPGGEHRHRGVGSGGNLRAAVFGVSDGLVSNASLIMGIAGAAADNSIVLLTGAAGLVAGAFSMAAGEYVSVRSQREMYEYQIGLEREELEHYPEAEAEELALIYQARGLGADEAGAMATRIIANPNQALDTLAREELGLNPDDLGNPIGAALSSFASFAAGASLPLLPFLIGRGGTALLASVAATAVGLFAIGACLSLFTGRSALFSGVRMLVIGATAGAITFGVGHLLGVSLS